MMVGFEDRRLVHGHCLPFTLTGNVVPLRKRLHTHKVFTKDQRFYLNYHKFSIKSYVLDVY